MLDNHSVSRNITHVRNVYRDIVLDVVHGINVLVLLNISGAITIRAPTNAVIAHIKETTRGTP